MASSQHMHKAAVWMNHQVEREGIARLTILILLLTTVAMLAYTWGYAEGVHNSQSEHAEEVLLSGSNKHGVSSIAELRHISSSNNSPSQPAPAAAGTAADYEDAAAKSSDLPSSTVVDNKNTAAGNTTQDEAAHHAAVGQGGQALEQEAAGGSATPDLSNSRRPAASSSQGGSSSSSSSGSSDGPQESKLQPHSRADDGSENDAPVMNEHGAYDITVSDYSD